MGIAPWIRHRGSCDVLVSGADASRQGPIASRIDHPRRREQLAENEEAGAAPPSLLPDFEPARFLEGHRQDTPPARRSQTMTPRHQRTEARSPGLQGDIGEGGVRNETGVDLAQSTPGPLESASNTTTAIGASRPAPDGSPPALLPAEALRPTWRARMLGNFCHEAPLSATIANLRSRRFRGATASNPSAIQATELDEECSMLPRCTLPKGGWTLGGRLRRVGIARRIRAPILNLAQPGSATLSSHGRLPLATRHLRKCPHQNSHMCRNQLSGCAGIC